MHDLLRTSIESILAERNIDEEVKVLRSGLALMASWILRCLAPKIPVDMRNGERQVQ